MAASVAALLAAPSAAQKPDEPLGEILEVLPLPETLPAPEQAEPPPVRVLRTPPVPPGRVVPVELPPSGATGELVYEDVIEAGVPEIAATEGPTAAELAAEAAWAQIQEERRAAVNAVESPIIDRLNAEQAAKAEAAGRRFVEEQAAYEREIAELEEEARRRREEHEAAMEAHARRVARERAEYRARVEACLAGDRRACE